MARVADVHAQLMSAATLLERTMRDVQDIEFTIEAGKLCLLQSRSAKRSASAAVHHAVSLESEGIITADRALEMITPNQLTAFLRPHLAPDARATATLLASVRSPAPG